MTLSKNKSPYLALSLSGGGSRAMAFHLGCLRALQDRKILDKVKVISTVSGGSVIGASWAYSSQNFEDFDRQMTLLLKRGIQRDIFLQVFFSKETLKIVATFLVTGLIIFAFRIITLICSLARNLLGIPTLKLENFLGSITSMLPIWGSFTTAFISVLNKRIFKNKKLTEVERPNLDVIINACDLKTGTAFRFGSGKSGGWRYGTIVGELPSVAKAVAASAAFPILLPPLIENFEFEKDGKIYHADVSLTDGGVYDNLGVAAIEPGKSSHSIFNYPVSHIISLNAGGGQLSSEEDYYWWKGRVSRSFTAVHRKAQDAIYQRLHKFIETGELDGFGLIYLGQQDRRLPYVPPDLVKCDEVRNYPTDFAAMSNENLDLLTKRGEQLTHIIVDRYLQNLIS